ncbi:hypothetical protein GMSM_20010 [Geomonas sp. Red276]
MKTALAFLALVPFLAVQPAELFAEDYLECRARCAQESYDCMNATQGDDPAAQKARDVDCIQRTDGCNSFCETLRPLPEEPPPQENQGAEKQ